MQLYASLKSCHLDSFTLAEHTLSYSFVHVGYYMEKVFGFLEELIVLDRIHNKTKMKK